MTVVAGDYEHGNCVNFDAPVERDWVCDAWAVVDMTAPQVTTDEALNMSAHFVYTELSDATDKPFDGFSVGDVQDVVIRDRQMLAQDGIFIIFGIINASNGKLRKSPDIISRGFVYLRESQELLHEVRLVIKETIERTTRGMNPINVDFVKESITDEVSKFLGQKTAKRPMVIPVILTI
jgi:mRNA degradation ribonuclease J1/J2